MLISTSRSQIDSFLKEVAEHELEKRCKVLTTTVSDSSKIQSLNIDPTRLRFPGPFRKWRFWMKLALVHWYLPDEIKCLTHLWLQENIVSDKTIESEFLLDSKELALGWLLCQDEMSDNDFWGNIVDGGRFFSDTLINQIWFQISEFRRPIKGDRIRGYRDKGSLRPKHRSLIVFSDKLLTEEDLVRKQLEMTNRKLTLLQLIKDRLRVEFEKETA